MKVAVVGTGHGGCAIAAVLAKNGHDVGLLKLGKKMHIENFNVLRRGRKIQLTGIEGEGEFDLWIVTDEASELIPQVDLVLVFYVSNYHRLVAERIGSFLNERQTVVLNPGYMGSLLFEREIARREHCELPLFAEFETLPYSSRIIRPGCVWISSRNVRHPFAAYPAGRAAELRERLEPVIGTCVPRSHLLEVALHNPNLVIHTIGVLLNMASVESREKRFAMYRDGFSPAVWEVVFKLDEEKMAILEKLGVEKTPYFEEFKLRTFVDDIPDPFEAFKMYADEAPDGPFSVDHRYVTEDLPMGLGLLHSLGQLTGVQTPVCDSLINIAAAALPQHDFWSGLRTIESVWDGSLDELLHVLTR